MKISITGASGHIGNNLCRKLIEKGHQLKVLVNKTGKALEGLELEKVHGSLLDQAVINELINGADIVYHVAAIISIGNVPKDKVFEINTKGTKNVVNSCLKYKVKRLIHFSSIHALHSSNRNAVLNENNPQADESDFTYDQSKAMGESVVLEGCARGLSAIILNPSSVVGPFDFMPSLVGQMFIKIATGKLPFLIPGGYHFVDVRDVVNAAINAIEMGRSGERYLLTSEWKSLMDVARIACKYSNKMMPLKIPLSVAWIGLPFISLWSKITGNQALYTNESLSIIAHSPKFVENKKAQDELHFICQPVNDTFADAYKWFSENSYLI